MLGEVGGGKKLGQAGRAVRGSMAAGETGGISAAVAAVGCWVFEWLTEGGDSPNDLLEQPIEGFVNSLFRRVEKPSALW